MKMLEKLASLSDYTDPMFVGMSPRNVQEAKTINKGKYIGAAIGAAIGAGGMYADIKHNGFHVKSPKDTRGKAMLQMGVGGALIGSIGGNYIARKNIAADRKAKGQTVYDIDDVRSNPVFDLDSRLGS